MKKAQEYKIGWTEKKNFDNFVAYLKSYPLKSNFRVLKSEKNEIWSKNKIQQNMMNLSECSRNRNPKRWRFLALSQTDIEVEIYEDFSNNTKKDVTLNLDWKVLQYLTYFKYQQKVLIWDLQPRRTLIRLFLHYRCL